MTVCFGDKEAPFFFIDSAIATANCESKPPGSNSGNRMTGRLPCAAKAWISASALIVVASSWGPKLGVDYTHLPLPATLRCGM